MVLVEVASGAAAVACSLVLLTAGVLKVRHPSTFTSQIISYQIVPRRVAALLGHTLPGLEMLAGLLILLAPRIGGPLCALLFLSFAGAVGINVLRGRTELTCGCFGPSGRQPIRASHVVVNLLLAGSAGLATLQTGRPTLVAMQLGLAALLLFLLARSRRRVLLIKSESAAE